jgi:hypothetical protein
LELYSNDTGDPLKYVSLIFHQANRYWGQIRYNNTGFRLTQGYSDELVNLTVNNFYASTRIGLGNTNPRAQLSIGPNQDKYVSTSGINLDGPIEFLTSNWASGYGHKIQSEDGGGGIMNLNIYGRQNTTNWTNVATFRSNGNIGFGTTNPLWKVTSRVDNASAISVGFAMENCVPDGGVSAGRGIALDFAMNTWGNPSATTGRIASVDVGWRSNVDMVFYTMASDALAEKMRIRYNGNILIGKTSQDNTSYKLDVAGKIRADEVVVNTTGADFVFDPGYKLPTLSELETYIKENNHLPEIASATEMKENGVSVSEMQTKLLQKIEELTLYVIELKKENENLTNRLTKLEK